MVADTVAATILPLICLLASGGAVLGAYVLAGPEPSPVVLVVVGVVGGVLGFLATPSIISPPIPTTRRLLAVAAGVIGFAVAGRLIPFSMVDDKPFPFRPIDVLEEVALLGGSYGSMFLASFAVLRWPWTWHTRRGRRTSA
jgi:hypothetical protein